MNHEHVSKPVAGADERSQVQDYVLVPAALPPATLPPVILTEAAAPPSRNWSEVYRLVAGSAVAAGVAIILCKLPIAPAGVPMKKPQAGLGLAAIPQPVTPSEPPVASSRGLAPVQAPPEPLVNPAPPNSALKHSPGPLVQMPILSPAGPGLDVMGISSAQASADAAVIAGRMQAYEAGALRRRWR